jgi:hypothetical protein
MPILYRAGLRAMQFRSGDAHQFEHLICATYRECGFGLFSVGLTVRPSVEPRHHDSLTFLNPTRISPSLCTQQEGEQDGETSSDYPS